MSIDPQRLKHVFLGAVEIADRGERQAWIVQECGSDLELLAKVQALLKARDDPDSFLDRLAPAPDALPETTGAEQAEPAPETPRPAPEPGQHIGKYRLLQHLGEGGFGIVYLAEQQRPVQRKVAIKVLKPGLDSAAVLARFEAERQALALMDHPNIARVFDAGLTDDGRPYFVMELIKGIPITKYCDQERLSPKERLDLFIPVCNAVQHAHQKGIIHRDLKPSNVLVALYDGRPVPKVIDFGVAKATGQKLTERTMFTEVGQIIGTLEYMAPEQAELNNLDIDTRADVYSLGVLLYELLTGSPPFTARQLRSAAFSEMLRLIREVEPPKPSTRVSTAENLPNLAAARKLEPKKLATLMRGDLDWIVMKCLEKERGRRYETANGLALEIQRYLADEPVMAGPPTIRYRLRKFVTRNKGSVAAVSLILLCLLGGVIGTSAGLVWAVRERDDKARALLAETEAKEAEIQAGQAKDQALAAETKARAAERQARDQAMAALRAMTDEVVENQMARDTTLTEENKAFLRKIIEQFEGFAAITADDADSRAIRAEGYHRVGVMRYRLGELKEAEAAYGDALAIRKQLAADFPKRPEFRRDLAASYGNLGSVLRVTGRSEEAETTYGDALAIFKQLADEYPDPPEFRQYLAGAYTNLGGLLRLTGRPKEAGTAHAAALGILRQLAAEFPKRPEFHLELARSHCNLGNSLRDTDRIEEAEAAYADALAIHKRLAAEFPKRPEFREQMASCYLHLGALLETTGRPKEAETSLGDALAILKQLAAEYPTRPGFREKLAATRNNLGGLLRDAGRLGEAEAAYAGALAIWKQLAAEFPNQPNMPNGVALTLVNLAQLCILRREFKTAKTYLDEASPYQQAALKANPRNPNYRQCFEYSLTVLVRAHAGLQDQTAALQAARKLRDLGWSPPGDAYSAADALALCIPIAEKDEQLDAAKRQAAVQFYGDEVMKMLRDAVAKGWKDPARLATESTPAPLRDREDFKKLLAELQGDKGKGKE